MPAAGPPPVWRASGPPLPPPPGAGPGRRPPGGAPPPPPASGPPPSSPPPGWQPQSAWQQPTAPAPVGGTLFRLHPLTVGDVLDGAFRALRATFATAAIVVLLVHGPYQLLSSLVLDQAVPEMNDPMAFEQLFVADTVDVAFATRFLIFVGVTAIVGLLVQVIVGAALAWTALRTDRDEDVSAGSALRASFAVSGATLGGTVLVGLVGVGIAFLVAFVAAVLFALAPVAGVILLVLAMPVGFIAMAALFGGYLLVIPIAVAERHGAWTTFRRAMWVVRNRFWRVVGVMLLLGLVLVAVSLGFSLVLGFAAELAGGLGWIIDGVSGAGLALLTAPVTIYVALLLYLDARVRLEGYDLEVRARGLEQL